MFKNKPYQYFLLSLFLIGLVEVSNAQIWTYSYPENIVNSNQALVKRSDKYEVQVTQGNTTKDCYVMYDKNQQSVTGNGNVKKNPDNHWTNFSIASGAVQVKITRIDGGNLTAVDVYPLKKGYSASVSGNVATINIPAGVDKLQLYVDVNGLDNDPLFIFVDPEETDVPNINGSNVTVIKTTDNIATVISKLNDSKTYKYFEPGVHKWGNTTNENYDGYKLPIKSGKKVYLPGGAYVIGSFQGNNQSNWKVYGRGIISGAGLNILPTAQYIPWSAVHHSGGGKGITIEGITSMCPPHFALTIRGECLIDNVKMMSWWGSTDGTITGDNSEVNNCFFKVMDDGIKVYGNKCTHDNNTMYQQVNGAPFQFSWSGQHADNCTMTNTYIVNSVYKGLGNTSNTAVINVVNHTSNQTTKNHFFDGIYIDNGCHRFLGLDPNNGSYMNFNIKNVVLRSGNKSTPQAASSYLSGGGSKENFTICDFYIDGKLITGISSSGDNPNNGKWWFKGQSAPITFCTDGPDVDSDGDGVPDNQDGCPNDANKIAPGECGCGVAEGTCNNDEPTDVDDLQVVDFSCNEVELAWGDVAGETGYRIRRKVSGEAAFTNLGDVPANTTSYIDQSVNENNTYIYQVRPVVNDAAVKASNNPTVIIPNCMIDSDNDGTPDDQDGCPNDANKIAPGECGCGVAEGTCNNDEPTGVDDLQVVDFSCSEVELAWGDVAGETGYRIRRKVSGEATFTNLGDVSANTTTYIDQSVNENTTYIYQVRPVVNNVAVKASNTPSVDVPECDVVIPEDCAGVAGGTASIDDCGVCSGGNTGITPNTTCLDCNGDVNGTASIDDCGVCSGGNTGVTPNAICTDCAGVAGGTASIDDCGICSGGNTGIEASSPKVWYSDIDEDGLGNPAESVEDCEQPIGYVANADDECPNDATNECNDQSDCEQIPVFDPSAIYSVTGTQVLYEGKVYQNKWYITGTVPGSGDAWELVSFCTAEPLDCSGEALWQSAAVYAQTGTQVIYEGNVYQNKWYSSNNTPGIHEVWQIVGPCSSATTKLESSFEGSEGEIGVRPNPVYSTLALDGVAIGESVEVYNTTGELVLSTEYTGEVDVSSLFEGLYFVKVNGASGTFLKY